MSYKIAIHFAGVSEYPEEILITINKLRDFKK